LKRKMKRWQWISKGGQKRFARSTSLPRWCWGWKDLLARPRSCRVLRSLWCCGRRLLVGQVVAEGMRLAPTPLTPVLSTLVPFSPTLVLSPLVPLSPTLVLLALVPLSPTLVLSPLVPLSPTLVLSPLVPLSPTLVLLALVPFSPTPVQVALECQHHQYLIQATFPATSRPHLNSTGVVNLVVFLVVRKEIGSIPIREKASGMTWTTPHRSRHTGITVSEALTVRGGGFPTEQWSQSYDIPPGIRSEPVKCLGLHGDSA
jgi:hypothetical protein